MSAETDRTTTVIASAVLGGLLALVGYLVFSWILPESYATTIAVALAIHATYLTESSERVRQYVTATSRSRFVIDMAVTALAAVVVAAGVTFGLDHLVGFGALSVGVAIGGSILVSRTLLDVRSPTIQ